MLIIQTLVLIALVMSAILQEAKQAAEVDVLQYNKIAIFQHSGTVSRRAYPKRRYCVGTELLIT